MTASEAPLAGVRVDREVMRLGIGGDEMRGFAAIGLDNPKCPANVGGVLRAAGCYGAAMVAMSGHRFRKVPTDVKKQWRLTPVIETADLRLVIPYDCVPVAVDLVPGARSLASYTHPERAFYIFGAEDATLGERVLSWCRDVVYVPTHSCMNLAATANVVLYDRTMKMGGDTVRERFKTHNAEVSGAGTASAGLPG